MPAAIWALAIAAFGIGTTQFIIHGWLPFTLTATAAMNTSYALGVFVGAPLLVVLGLRLPRKAMLMGLLGFFIAGNLLTALAPSFDWVLAGPMLTASPTVRFSA